MSGPRWRGVRDAMARRVAMLAALLAVIAWLASGVTAHGRTLAVDRELIDEDFTRNRLLGELVRAGVLEARPRAETLEQPPPARRGMLRFVPVGAPPEPLPSTALAADEAAAHPDRDYVSLAIDPRDWDDPVVGITTHPTRRGEAWVRGATATWFVGGRPAAASTIGLSVHGDSSRRQPRTSLRVRCTQRFSAQMSPADLLPGARGSTFVLHNDWRRLRFVNPISYDLLRHIGVEAPRTRPVRVLVNGKLLAGVFFVTEYLDEDHIAARLGSRDLSAFQPSREAAPHDYRKLVALVRTAAPTRVLAAADRFDLDGVQRMLAGLLLLAPYDCLQGFAYRGGLEQRWCSIAYDLDWGFGPWPVGQFVSPAPETGIVTYLNSNLHDLRGVVFDASMRQPSELRAQLLRRIRQVFDHDATAVFWRERIAHYRRIAERLLDPDERTAELRSLDQIAAFVAERPEHARAELAAAYQLGACHRLDIEVPDGADVSIDDRRIHGRWVGHAFAGEELVVRAEPPHQLQVQAPDALGEPVRELRLTVQGPLRISAVIAR